MSRSAGRSNTSTQLMSRSIKQEIHAFNPDHQPLFKERVCKTNMCVFIKVTPYCRSSIECIRNPEKWRQRKNKISRSSFKEVRIEKFITPLASCYSKRNQAFSIRHKGTHHEKFVPSRRMSYIHTYVRVALATSDVQRILEIPATDEIYMEDQNHGLARTNPNSGTYNTLNSR